MYEFRPVTDRIKAMHDRISDRIIVFYEGEIVADVRPEEVTVNELGLYMSGSKRKGAVK